MTGIGPARLTLRKLHIRWFHASESAMLKLLKRAGIPNQILDLIPPIVQTCKVCRNWQQHGPANVTSINIADKFNEQVECDLMFFKGYIFFHLIDRCVRWHHAIIISDKTESECQRGIASWVQIHGPMQVLYMDSESGVVISEQCRIWLHRQGIKLTPRAKGQQMPYIDRRTALFRKVLLTIIDQLRSEGINIPIELILPEAVFVGNALLSVDNETPYNALYGRTPRILPNVNTVDNAGRFSEVDGTLRNVHRLREIVKRADCALSVKVTKRR